MAGEPLPFRDPEPAFDRLTRVGARMLGVAGALVAMAGEGGSPDGLPGRVVALGAPLVLADARGTADAEDMVAFAGYPLYAGGSAIGAFCAFDDAPRRWSAEDLELIADLAGVAQSELDMQAAGRVARTTSAMLEQLTALTDAARGADGVGPMLEAVSVQAQRAFGADGAAIVLLAGENEDTHRRRGGSGMLETPPSATIDPGGFAALVLSGETVRAIPDLREAGMGDSAIAAVGLRGAMGVPLIVSGRRTGFMIVGTRAARAWTRFEAQLLQLTAERLAGALEREERHDADRTIADTLQRALQPTRMPQVPGLQLAARYEPAENRLGGDWYDAFELADGRVGLAIGDVVGHGIGAAAAAVRLRHFLRGYVLRGEGPGEALRSLNTLVEEEPDAAYSSMVYLELDPRSGAFRWAGAGHLPPARLRDRGAALLDIPGGSLLGVLPLDPWPEGEGVLERGDRLVLYTDGLVERPGTDVDALTRVLMTVAAAAPGAEPLATALVSALPGPRRDDAAVLVAVRT